MRRPLHTLILPALALLSIAGCGGVNEEDLAAARDEGAREARLEERQREQRREQERLRGEIERLRRDRREETPPASGGGSSAPAAPRAASGTTQCGDGLSVGPNTTCAFARNVRSTYESSGGQSVIEVYSPVTKQTYTMSCSGSAPKVCRGGNDASVFFN